MTTTIERMTADLTTAMKARDDFAKNTLRQVIGIPRVPMNMIPGKGFDYGFLQFPQGAKPEIIETDVVIVGSGCGGGVCAKNLAEAGHKVIVVDSGYHWTPDHFPMTERQGMDNLFMNGGVISCKSMFP